MSSSNFANLRQPHAKPQSSSSQFLYRPPSHSNSLPTIGRDSRATSSLPGDSAAVVPNTSMSVDVRRYPESYQRIDSNSHSLRDIAGVHTFFDPEDRASGNLSGRAALERYPHASGTPPYPLPASTQLGPEHSPLNESSRTPGSSLVDYGNALRDYHLRQQHQVLQSALSLFPSGQDSHATYSEASMVVDPAESAAADLSSLSDSSQAQTQSQATLSVGQAYEASDALKGGYATHSKDRSSMVKAPHHELHHTDHLCIPMSNIEPPTPYYTYPHNYDHGIINPSLQANPPPPESLAIGGPVQAMHGVEPTNNFNTLQRSTHDPLFSANVLSQEHSDLIPQHSPMEEDLSSSMEVTPDPQPFPLSIDLEEQTEMAREEMQGDLAALRKKKRAKMHECPVCQKSFPRPSGLKTHMNIHNNEKPYVCEFPGCNRTFGVRSNARRHLRTHGIIPPPVQSAGEEPYVVGFSEPLIMPSHEPPVGQQESCADAAEEQGISSRKGGRGRRPTSSRVAAFRVRWQTPKIKKAGDVATSGLTEDEAAQPDDTTPRPNRFQALATLEPDTSASSPPLSLMPPTQGSSSSVSSGSSRHVQRRRR